MDRIQQEAREILVSVDRELGRTGRYNNYEFNSLSQLKQILDDIANERTENKVTEFRNLCTYIGSKLGNDIDSRKESMHWLFTLTDKYVIRNLEANNFRARLENSQERSQESRNTDSRSHNVSREANILS